MTLGQASGGQPRRIAPPKGSPNATAASKPVPVRPSTGGVPGAARPAPIRQGLGLHLGLNPMQRAYFQQAAQGGRGVDWMTAHPGVMNRVSQFAPTGARQTALQNFIGTGQSQRPQRPQPPTGQNQPPPGAQGLQPGSGFNPSMGQVGGNMYGQMPASSQPQQMPQSGFQVPGQGPMDQSQSAYGGAPQQGLQQQGGPNGSYLGWTGDNAAQQAGLQQMSQQGGSGYAPDRGFMGNPGMQQPQYGGGFGRNPYGVNPGMQSVIQSRTGMGQMGNYYGQGGMYAGGQLPAGSTRSGGTYGPSGPISSQPGYQYSPRMAPPTGPSTAPYHGQSGNLFYQ